MLPEKLAIGCKEEDAAVERSSFALYDPDREMDSVFPCHRDPVDRLDARRVFVFFAKYPR